MILDPAYVGQHLYVSWLGIREHEASACKYQPECSSDGTWTSSAEMFQRHSIQLTSQQVLEAIKLAS